MVGTPSSTENLEETPGAVAQRLHEERLRKEMEEDTRFQEMDTENDEDFGDPNPPPANASSEQKLEYSRAVNEYSKEILEHLQAIPNLKGEELWIEYTCTFQKRSIKAMSGTQQIDWTRFLRSRGVCVRHRRGSPRWKSLQDCLQAKVFEPATVEEDEEIHVGTVDQVEIPLEPNQPRSSNARRTGLGLHNKDICAKTRDEVHQRRDEDQDRRIVQDDSKNPGSSSQTSGYSRRGPLGALMKAYQGQTKYSGSFVEDFEGAIEQYNTLCGILDLSDEDKANGFPIMLTGAAFAHYSRQYAKKDLTYKELVDHFRSWYTSEEQKKRLLNIWQTPSLTRELQASPEKSELEVFQKLADKLVRVQNQLHSDYHEDRFLRDQLMRAADIAHLQHSLNDKVPNTAQEAMHRIANRLSAEPKSAGAHFASDSYDQANYWLGMKFGGKAQRTLKGTSQRSSKKNLSKLLASAKGCYVCGGPHRARQAHTPQEILTAIERIKRENPTALFSIDDVMDVQYALAAAPSGDDESGEESETDSDREENAVSWVSLDETDEVGRDAHDHFANVAFVHGRTFASDMKKEMDAIEAALSVGETSRFDGIVLDTGANRSSVMSLDQYRAYCREFKIPMRIDESDKKNIIGLGSRNHTLGTAQITIPFYDLDLWIDVNFRIVDTSCPSLLCLKDMIQNGLDISIQDRIISFKHKRQALTFENYFLIHRWSPHDMSFYTEPELKRLHRVFGHPSVTALKHLLRRADPDNVNNDVKRALSEIVRECMTCAKHAAKTRRFKITVGTDDLRFNHILAVDIMYINQKPLIHVVDEATHYQAASFLKRVTAEETWKAILKCWIRVYLGPPDHLRIDQGSQFVSKHFRDSVDAEGITLLEAPVECPSTMSNVERYHAPLRTAYLKIRETLPRSETDAECLQIAIKAVNDTLGPEGLCPTLLVYGAIPRPLRRTPAEAQIRRAEALEAAMKAVHKEQAKRKIAFALRHPGGPKAKEHESELERLPAGAPVLVYREKSKQWEGPHLFINVDGSTVVVQTPSGRKIFRSHVVKSANKVPEEQWGKARSGIDEPDPKPSIKPETSVNWANHTDVECVFKTGACTDDCAMILLDEDVDEVSPGVMTALFDSQSVKQMRPSDNHNFLDSRKAEIDGLLQRDTFKIVDQSSVPKGTRVYGTRWVDCIKEIDGKKMEKSRLVAQNFKDKGATCISTKSPTVSRMGQRIAVATAALIPSHTSYIRDISQAYVQSETKLERLVYLRPPPEMGLKEDQLLLAKKPLYGIPESGLHWFSTYQRHHTELLEMEACKTDPCVLYKPNMASVNEAQPQAVVVLQVDDSYGHGDQEFLECEEQNSYRFKCKPRKLLRPGDAAHYNGTQITVGESGIHSLDQTSKLKTIKVPCTAKELICARAQVQYIATCTRPDLCAAVQLLASDVTTPDHETYTKMKKVVHWCHATQNVGLKFVPLDARELNLALFTDASFANTTKCKSQIGFVVVLCDGEGDANILHYGSSSCKRVTRSVMAAELLALVYGFDNAFVVQHMLSEILGKKVPLDGYVDSKTVFDIIAKRGSTLEKRLQIDAHALRESYARRELRSLAWIEGHANVADGLTKGLVDSKHALWKLMTTNRLELKPQGWVHNIHTSSGKP